MLHSPRGLFGEFVIGLEELSINEPAVKNACGLPRMHKTHFGLSLPARPLATV